MFCPTCRSDFHEHPLLDPYLRGYACGNRHVYYTTMIELVDDHLPQMLAYYAGDMPIIQPYVHPQLRAVLKRFDKYGPVHAH
jgi:hypothetical protein